MIESISTALIKSASIEEMVAHRDRALAIFEQMKSLRNDFATTCARGLNDTTPTIYLSLSQRGYDTDDIRADVDRYFWRDVLAKSGIKELMGAKQIAEFENQISKHPPEFSVENVQATFQPYMSNPRSVFDQSIVDLFERLPRCYKSNDAFKIGKRIVVTNAYAGAWRSWTHLSYGHDRRDQVRDLNRIFHILDGQKESGSFVDEIAVAMRSNETNVHDNRYIRVRWFMNGNAHLWLLRDDLVRDCNLILAEHYGKKLAESA